MRREGYACVGGIRSTGLSASMAIAEHVRDELGAAGLQLEPRAATRPELACRTSARPSRGPTSAAT